MKLLILVALFALAQANPIEPSVERVDDRTPESERRYGGTGSFIVNGQAANIADFPHMLALLRAGSKFKVSLKNKSKKFVFSWWIYLRCLNHRRS